MVHKIKAYKATHQLTVIHAWAPDPEDGRPSIAEFRVVDADEVDSGFDEPYALMMRTRAGAEELLCLLDVETYLVEVDGAVLFRA